MSDSLFFPWKKEYNLGISSIDEQHRKIVEYINNLYASLINDNQKEKSAEILIKLFRYADEHLVFEEDFFDDFGFSESEEHKKRHLEFKNDIRKFKEMSDKNFSVTFRLINFLKNWLKVHVIEEDKAYATEYLKIKSKE